ncbi:MAG: hypothetical protein ABJF23_16425 [Bryobacteraceae bacterium]
MTNKLLILSIFAAMSTASIHAQERINMKVNVPFSFHVGKTTLPAGIYTVRSHEASFGLLTIKGQSDGGINIGTIPNSTLHPSELGKVVFQKYGDDYFLSQVRAAHSTAVATLRKTPQELELIARGATTDQTTLVARSK